ncbi:MAG: hypothetical protein JRE23_18930 [Deltaproteobacteria bacterium]|nr:hypothetical protein [Deltaproteobacteria bacterium]
MSEELITNGDFEDGDFSGWTAIIGEVFINDVLNPYFEVLPISGEYDAIMIAYPDPENDHEGALMVQVSASLPENIVSATFSWSDRIFNFHDDFVTGTGGFPPTDGQEFAVYIASRSYDVTEGAQSSEGLDVPILFLVTGFYDDIVCMIDNVSLKVYTTDDIVEVNIDIKPGSDPNCFNNDGHGVIPVAILGSVDFDVNTIDAGSVMLEGLAVKAVGKSNKLLAHYNDINSDGHVDLVVQIEDDDLVFEEGDTIATVTGKLKDGMPIQGSDTICIVP